MALASDQPLSINVSNAFSPGIRSAAARHEDDRGGPNARIAEKLRQAGEILAAQGAAPYRVAAYRHAAGSVRALNEDLSAIAARGGRKALEAVPFIGASIASATTEMLATGGWRFLEHLKGSAPARKPCSGRSRALDRFLPAGSARP